MAFREVRVFEVRDNEAPRIMRRRGSQAGHPACRAAILVAVGAA